jgi:hypothetical protein
VRGEFTMNETDVVAVAINDLDLRREPQVIDSIR